MSIKMYFTPRQKNKLHQLISRVDDHHCKSKTKVEDEHHNFESVEDEFKFFLKSKWQKPKYIKIIVTLIDISTVSVPEQALKLSMRNKGYSMKSLHQKI